MPEESRTSSETSRSNVEAADPLKSIEVIGEAAVHLPNGAAAPHAEELTSLDIIRETKEMNLYGRILDSAAFAAIEGPSVEEEGVINARILTDKSLEIDGKRVALRPGSDALFLFNALMRLRASPCSATELRECGFRERAHINVTFSNGMKALVKMLNQEHEIVMTTSAGRWRRYKINPLFRVRDERISAGPAAPGEITANATQDAVDRADAIIDVVKKYQDSPFVHGSLAQYRKASESQVVMHNSKWQYLDDMSHYRLLDAGEEPPLFLAIERGLAVYQQDPALQHISPAQEQALLEMTAAYKVLFATNLRLVTEIAKRYKPSGVMSYLDLVQEGNIGLSKAIRKFDVMQGNKFSTFAYTAIKNDIKRAIADKGRAVRLPVYTHDKWLGLRRIMRDFLQEQDREPTIAEVAAKAGITEEKAATLLCVGEAALSLNKRIDDESDTEFGDLIPAIGAEATYFASDPGNSETINQLFEQKLEPREQLVLSLRFGVYIAALKDTSLSDGGRKITYGTLFPENKSSTPYSQSEVGELLICDPTTVGRIEEAAIQKLRGEY